MSEKFSLSHAKELDINDPLREYRDRFIINDHQLVYLDGNSLGRLPLQTIKTIDTTVQEQWGDRLIRSWNEAWYLQSSRLGKRIAQIIGAHPDEVIVSDSTSVNLYKLVYAVLKIMDGRLEIISDDMNFPSDLYILQGLIKQFGEVHTLRLLKSADGISSDMTELLRMINRKTALVTLSHVAFKSAYMYDIDKVTELAHMHGSLVLWDLSHSVGAVPISLKRANVDLAIGCTYKYLNGGPGSPAFLYVRKDLQEKLENPIQGWFGDQHPFEFKLHYRTADGIRKFLTGTPPVVSVSTLEPSLDLVIEAGIGAIRQKSVQQSEYLISLAREWLFSQGFRLGSPEYAEKRGSHVSLKHAEAYRICKALIDPEVGNRIVIPDFREPNNIRLGLSPLYTTYEEIYSAVDQLRYIMENKIYEKYPRTRDAVT
ncbi:MAG: kynureninase [Bacteroidales bacterium]|nr:kynureninase [Bacteroidales bacterium]